MALQVEQECPHESQLAVEQMVGHHAHHEAAETHDCVTVQSDCCEGAIASQEARGGKFKTDADDVVFAAVDTRRDATHALPARCIVAHPPDPVVASRPLHKLFCVYLD